MNIGDQLVLKYRVPHSKEQLWQLLTNLDEMKKWYFDSIPSFEPEVGFKTHFTVNNETRTFTHQWLVTEVDKNHLIAYDWTFAEYEGKSKSKFEIIEDKDGMVLIITINILKSFPEDIPEFTMESCEGGWNWFMDRLQNAI